MKLNVKTAQLRIEAERINFYYFDNLYLESLFRKYENLWPDSWLYCLRYTGPFWISEPTRLKLDKPSLIHFRRPVFAEIHSVVDYLSLENVFCIKDHNCYTSKSTVNHRTGSKSIDWVYNSPANSVLTTFLIKL